MVKLSIHQTFQMVLKFFWIFWYNLNSPHSITAIFKLWFWRLKTIVLKILDLIQYTLYNILKIYMYPKSINMTAILAALILLISCMIWWLLQHCWYCSPCWDHWSSLFVCFKLYNLVYFCHIRLYWRSWHC